MSLRICADCGTLTETRPLCPICSRARFVAMREKVRLVVCLDDLAYGEPIEAAVCGCERCLSAEAEG